MIDNSDYVILPFTFQRLPESYLLIVNQSGDYYFITSDEFNLLLNSELSPCSDTFYDLKSKHFITDSDPQKCMELIATKLRTRKSFLRNFTALHMVVITKRCNFSCAYCHASSEPPEQKNADMILDTAKKVVETIFQSPSPIIKIEFQGGEPLLNWDIVKFITEYASLLNIKAKRKIEFVICTNLTLLEEYMIDFIKKYNICISTSLDGTKNLHDSCRINRMGHSGYDLFKQKLQLVKEKIGVNGCSALLTVTKSNINHLQEVINEYISCGFNGIFLRALNPYGFAKREWAKMGYPIEDFIKIYKETLKFIINLNLEGKRFIEFYASILLSRILTPFSTGFMDLQSPAGAAISGVIYDYNGDVYPTDESRMLARSGDRKFLMGNVLKSSYSRIFNGNKIREIIRSSNVEVLPQCASCVFQLYCGVDPIRNYAETKDIIGHRPTSEFCKKNTGIIQFLFDLIRENNPDVMDVFWSWVTHRSLEEIRG